MNVLIFAEVTRSGIQVEHDIGEDNVIYVKKKRFYFLEDKDV